MSRTKMEERINKLFSILQEIVYNNCKGLVINDKFFLETPVKMHSAYTNRLIPTYAVIDVYTKGFMGFFKKKYYGRIILFEGGLVEAETKHKEFANYVQKITDEYRKCTKNTAIYYYHH